MVGSPKPPPPTALTPLPQASTRGKRPSIRTKLAPQSQPKPAPLLSRTKKSKRTSKHLTFLTKISKPALKTTSIKKRRRPSKPLLATLQSLADALPETTPITNKEGDAHQIPRKKSLKSRPGASKRKGKVERLERERFNRNLAQMALEPGVAKEGEAGTTSPPIAAATSTRWAALRGYLSQTLERREGFCS